MAVRALPGAPFGGVCALFFMFLSPVPPLHLFLFTGTLIVLFAVGRPRGDAGFLIPF